MIHGVMVLLALFTESPLSSGPGEDWVSAVISRDVQLRNQDVAAEDLSSEMPGFDRRMSEHNVEIVVKSTDGNVIRRGAGVISSNAGYVMTSLDVVVGGSEYFVSGPAIGSEMKAAPLAVTRAGETAILQIIGDLAAGYVSLPRSTSPPVSGDTVYAPLSVSQGSGHREGRITGTRTDPGGSLRLQVSFGSTPGTGLYNSRGALVAVVKAGPRQGVSTIAVFVPDKMPGDWVLYFPARMGDPIAKKAVTIPPP